MAMVYNVSNINKIAHILVIFNTLVDKLIFISKIISDPSVLKVIYNQTIHIQKLVLFRQLI